MISLASTDRQSMEAVRPATSFYGPETGFTENVAAVVQDFARENLMGSKRAAFSERFNEQLDVARKLGISELPALPDVAPPTPDELREIQDKFFGNTSAVLNIRADKWDRFFAKLKQEHPDAGFMTIADTNDDIAKDFAEKRYQTASIRARATFKGDVGATLGYVAAPLQEPLVVATLPFGAAGSAGILRAMLEEALLAAGTEAVIQPEVLRFKEQIDSPYTVEDAVTNVVTAGAGAGLISGVIKAAPLAYRGILNEIRARRAAGELPPPTPTQRAAEQFLEQYVDEIESNPNRRDQPDSLPVHTENLKTADAAVMRGEGIEPDHVKATKTGEPERRQDAAQRQRIDTLRNQIQEMTGRVERGEAKPKELTKLLRELETAIYTDPLTGIPNKRAWDEAEKKGFVASIDLDGFKVVNDKMGHDVGDDMLRLAGRILMEETGAAFRKGGDEFAAHGGKGASLEKALKRAKERLAKEKLTVTLPDGRQITKTGIDLTYAIGRDFKEADFNLAPLKDAKRKLRAERGGAVDGLVTTPAARVQDNLNRGPSDRSAADLPPQVKTPQSPADPINEIQRSALSLARETAAKFGVPDVVEGVYLVGSRATGKARKTSDVDILVKTKPDDINDSRVVAFEEELQSKLDAQKNRVVIDGAETKVDYFVSPEFDNKNVIKYVDESARSEAGRTRNLQRAKRAAQRSADDFDSNPAASNEILQAEVQRVLDENPDMMVPDADGNPVRLRDLADEIKEDDEALSVVNACLKVPE